MPEQMEHIRCGLHLSQAPWQRAAILQNRKIAPVQAGSIRRRTNMGRENPWRSWEDFPATSKIAFAIAVAALAVSIIAVLQ